MKALTPCEVAAELEVVVGAEDEVLEEAGVVPVPVLVAEAAPVLEAAPVPEAVAEELNVTP